VHYGKKSRSFLSVSSSWIHGIGFSFHHLKYAWDIMIEYLMQSTWSPYIAGAGIGILGCLTFILSDRPLGASTAYAKMSGLIGRAVSKEAVGRNEYYRLTPPAVDWQFMIVPGIIIGAFISAMLSGSFHPAWVPAFWGVSFGYNPLLRLAGAVIGGILLALGSRWAGGCTSGHGISGTMQLSLGSIAAAACFFIGGIATAVVLFRIIGS
jgi:uncharacterized membrane protein YedE/YeeE